MYSMEDIGYKRGRGRPFGTITGKHPTRNNGRVTPLYGKWVSMHARCYQKSHPAYPYYGGKGIVVCDRWHGRSGFDNFVDDMGPNNGLTLERIDRTKPYGPDNCKWATWKEQAQNRGKTGKLGGPETLAYKCRAYGIPYHVAFLRIKRLGWEETEALSTPVQRRG